MKNPFAKKNPNEVQIIVGGASRVPAFIDIGVVSIGAIGGQAVLMTDQVVGSLEQYAAMISLVLAATAIFNLIRYVLKASPAMYGKTHTFANSEEAKAWAEKHLTENVSFEA